MWEVTAQGHSVLSDEVQRLLQPQIQLVKNPPASAADARDAGSIPGSGRSPGGGHGNPPQYSCLETPTDRGAQQVTVHRITATQIGVRRSYCGFGLYFPYNEKCGISFHVPTVYFYAFFEEMLIQIFCPLLKSYYLFLFYC